MRSMSSLAVTVLLATSSAACAAGAADGGDALTVTDSAGVQLVRTGGDPAALDADTLPLVEELRIGVLDGDPAYQFDRITGVATLSDGRIAVAENGTGSIRLYGTDGRHQRDVGRVGRGPGEFNRALVMMRVAGDTAVVMDYTQAVAYDLAQGTHVGTWRTMRAEGTTSSMVIPQGRSAAGWVVQVQGSRRDRPRPAPGAPQQDTVELRRAALATGEPSDVVLRYGGRRSYGLSGAMGEGEFGTIERLWEAWPGHVIGANGRLYVTPRDRYEIDVHDGDGRLLRRIARSHQPVPLGDDDVDAYAREIGAWLDSAVRSSVDRERERRYLVDEAVALGTPDALPPIGDLLVARDGTLWVQRTDVDVRPADLLLERRIPWRHAQVARRVQWDRFDADGRWLGAVRVPPRFVAHEVERDAILGVLRDESDVEYVVRYRVAAAR